MTREQDERIERLHAALRATEELPVERDASRWLGEAQAIAEDVAGSDLDESVRRERIERVRELLSHVVETGSEEADGEVAIARQMASEICEEK